MSGTSDCPRCRIPLLDESWSGVTIRHCPRCSGSLVPQASLVGYIAHRGASVVDGPRRVGDVGPVDACPTCAGPMKHVGYLGGDRVFVDRCDTCRVLWMDADEVEAIATMTGRGADPRATATPAPAVRIAGAPGAVAAGGDAEPCPRCSVRMHKVAFQGAWVSACTTCGGSLVPQPTLVALLTSLVPMVGGAFDDALPPPVPDAGPIGACPRCGQGTTSFGYMGMDRVQIDRCVPCNVLWADGHELLVMAALHARSHRRGGGFGRGSSSSSPVRFDRLFVVGALLGRRPTG